MPSKQRKGKTKGVEKKPKLKQRLKPGKEAIEKITDDETFRPPRIPKFLVKEPKKKRKEAVLDDVDDEPVYTDDYDNTILSTDY